MIDFSRDLVLASLTYVAVLLVVGGVARRARRERSMSDFYLAGRSLGFFVLLLTLFATQYSGNSLSGFPGQTYRDGLSYFMSVTFMVGIVSGYLLFAPQLFAVARRERLITPSDYLALRYGSPWLTYLSAAILLVTLCNYLLAQLLAMGHAVSGLTADRIPFAWGVVGGAAVIVAYEILGGMRAVAWTDVLQGALLFGGLLLVAVLLAREVGSPAAVVAGIGAAAPEKLAISNWRVCSTWASNLLLLGLGAPLYPQAVQRIYAAQRARELRRALAAMAFLPLVAITTVVFIGAVGIWVFPDLGRLEADAITFRVLAHLVELEPLAYYPVLVIMMAVVAAIMSTADSCLLSISSIIGKDVVARSRRLDAATAERLERWSPAVSIAVMGVLCLVALSEPSTLWDLLVIKFEILIQLSPAFVCGTAVGAGGAGGARAFRAPEILAGLLVGLATALGLHLSGARAPGGFHAGTLGVAVNYLTVFSGRRLRLRHRRGAPAR